MYLLPQTLAKLALLVEAVNLDPRQLYQTRRSLKPSNLQIEDEAKFCREQVKVKKRQLTVILNLYQRFAELRLRQKKGPILCSQSTRGTYILQREHVVAKQVPTEEVPKVDVERPCYCGCS